MAARSSPSPPISARARSWSRRGKQGGAARRQAREHLHRGPARGIRARLRLPDVPRQRAIRGPISAGHLDRAPADRQAPGRNRAPGRRRRDRPRRDRQGQRSGALRTERLCAGARHQGDRAVARMGVRLAHRADRLRRTAPDPDRQGQARRSAVLHRRQPPARLLRGQGARRPRPGDARLRLFAHRRSRIGAGQADRSSRSLSRRATPSPSTASAFRPPRCSPRSTSSATTTASAGSTSSRTASSA